MSFDDLYSPLEAADGWLEGLLTGPPLLVGLLVAFALGLRHASDPDHLVAVTSLVAAEHGDVRSGMRLGAWWGIGHAVTLILIGAPLIVLRSEVPAWLEVGAEKAVALVIVLLAGRVLWKWARGSYGTVRRRHVSEEAEAPSRGDGRTRWHGRARMRSAAQAFTIGVVHGLGGTGAVVVLLVAGLADRTQALAALAVFAPMSIVSMCLCTGVYAWALTRTWVQPLYETVLIPALGAFGLLFGAWYGGLT